MTGITTERDAAGNLVLRHKPWLAAAFGVPMGLGFVGAVVAGLVNHGLFHPDTYWPAVGAFICFGASNAFTKWWTIRFDRATSTMHWFVRGALGTESGEVPYGRVTSVFLSSLRPGRNDSRRNPKRGLCLRLGECESLRLTLAAAGTPGQIAAMDAIASRIRAEMGLPEDDDRTLLIDAVQTAASEVEAVRVYREMSGGSLTEAKQAVGVIRGA